MSKYRARLCPKCDYFIGFAITQHRAHAIKSSLTNFCLNCNYKLPVLSIIRGVRKVSRPTLRRSKLRLVCATPPSTGVGIGKKTMEARI